MLCGPARTAHRIKCNHCTSRRGFISKMRGGSSRTPRPHSCSRLSTVLLVFLTALCCSYGEFYNHQPPDARYFTFQCTKNWCGEKWGADRILYYNYSVRFTQEEQNVMIEEVTRNCSSSLGGTIHSTNCTSTVTDPASRKDSLQTLRVKHITRSHHSTVKLPESLSLGLIMTDNIDIYRNFTRETYPLNQDKIWQIRIPHGCRMVIFFQEFDIEASDGCTKDNFTVQTSKQQRNIRKYCDHVQRIELRFRRRVQLKFHSDDTNAARGIYATICMSNWPEIEGQHACSCNTDVVGPRRKPRSSSRESTRAEYRHMMQRRKEDEEIGTWLTDMMRNGLPTVEQYLRNSSNPKQQHLAQKFLKAIDAHAQRQQRNDV